MTFHIERFAWRRTAPVSISACQRASLVSFFRGRQGMKHEDGAGEAGDRKMTARVLGLDASIVGRRSS